MSDTEQTTFPPLYATPARVPADGHWGGQVPTDQLWLYLRSIELAHCHGSAIEPDAWGLLLWVSESPAQGWDLHLGCGCTLQSCFGDSTYEVRVVEDW